MILKFKFMFSRKLGLARKEKCRLTHHTLSVWLDSNLQRPTVVHPIKRLLIILQRKNIRDLSKIINQQHENIRLLRYNSQANTYHPFHSHRLALEIRDGT